MHTLSRPAVAIWALLAAAMILAATALIAVASASPVHPPAAATSVSPQWYETTNASELSYFPFR